MVNGRPSRRGPVVDHPGRSKEPCPRWESTGECVFGDVCKFALAHVGPGGRENRPPTAKTVDQTSTLTSQSLVNHHNVDKSHLDGPTFMFDPKPSGHSNNGFQNYHHPSTQHSPDFQGPKNASTRGTFGLRNPSSQGGHGSQSSWRPSAPDNAGFQAQQHPSSPGIVNPPKPRVVRNEDDLREWKRLLRQAPTNRTARVRFFELAQKLVEGEVGMSQDMVKTLAQDAALHIIRTLIHDHLPQASSTQHKATIWVTELEPLMRVISHQRLMDSAVLEQEVFSIYNFLAGIGCQRMKALYDFIIELITSSQAENPPVSKSTLDPLSIIELSLAVLSKMIDSNSNNIINENFSTIVSILEPMLNDAAEAEGHSHYAELQARQWLTYIKRRLGVGNSLPLSVQQTNVTGPLAGFVLPKNLPGHLSSNGPRHDNDHSDIQKISILPTPEEIMSVRDEYLPTNQPSSFHIPGIIGRLDREFRLLREDTVGQLRDVVRTQLEKMQNPQIIQPRHKNMRIFTYLGAEPMHIGFDRLKGLDLLVKFNQAAIGRDSISREEWWMHSKRLQPGGLVCLVSGDGSTLFCVVSDRTRYRSGKASAPTDAALFSPKKASLADRSDYAYVHLRVAEAKQSNTLELLAWFQTIGPPQERCLVEFPGVLLPSFQHTLEALQQITKSPRMPFIDLIAPDHQRPGLVDIPPPQYATKPGFLFDLSSLTDGTPLQCGPDQPLDPALLSQHSTLDATQSAALLASLSRGLALIQGPPGTGKSYTGEKLIQVLLHNKKRAKLGPILCVCYTNHALDQLLEHLLDADVQQVIRIGSRSKSSRLENLNLRYISNNAERTRSENHSLFTHRNDLDAHIGVLEECITQLEACFSKESIMSHLAEKYPRYHAELSDVSLDEQGFQTVQHHQRPRAEQWLYGGAISNTPSRDPSQLLDTDLWTMTHEERQNLNCYWAHEIRDPIIDEFQREHQLWESVKDDRNRVAREVDLRCLSEADIVGVTTTGLAKNLDLLRRLPCKVLLCEEAGEVLEAHSLTALLPCIQHAIFIGDNLQLRPQIQNFELHSTSSRGAQYSLDMSMFERLVSPAHDDEQILPYNTLQTQRRMHPAISKLVQSTLYPNLDDGGPVADYPEVCGMKKRLFWFNHTSPEDPRLPSDPNSTSHINSFEVEMTVAIVQHLVRQGVYGADDIAVLTPYLGQLRCLRHRMKHLVEISLGDEDEEELISLEADDGKQQTGVDSQPPTASKTSLLKRVRLATVDNFQGEEAKVVIISLVRSNDDQRCGFLSTSNRINVLLSRAKHGMYIIGNSETYGNVSMWAQVIDILRTEGNIGNKLELECPRHPDSSLMVSQADHFLQHSPEGGCNKTCEWRLACGHACMYLCHSDMLHNVAKCLEPCRRPLKGCGHACLKACGDTCSSKCSVRVRDIELKLSCGHVITSAWCWQVQRPETIDCQTPVQKTIPGCEHTVTVPCCVDVDSKAYKYQDRGACSDGTAWLLYTAVQPPVLNVRPCLPGEVPQGGKLPSMLCSMLSAVHPLDFHQERASPHGEAEDVETEKLIEAMEMHDLIDMAV
ncbi:uncharacterized protein PG998_010593 [Apiospora kogelbergensis]|uniref:uncharacterized protein n=1 Tax=Apiospora kogelbergensis TaxID=1337665 RepID=UPI00312CF676